MFESVLAALELFLADEGKDESKDSVDGIAAESESVESKDSDEDTDVVLAAEGESFDPASRTLQKPSIPPHLPFVCNSLTALRTTPPDTENVPADSSANDMGLGDIVTVAMEAGSFSTLVGLVADAGLVETLQGPGPFTVFAPTGKKRPRM